MPADADEFAALVARARAGDASALTELARRYEPDIRLVARLRLGTGLRPYVDSLDLVQSVHKSLIRGLQQDRFDLTTPEQLVALALTMVRRKAARLWRRNQRQRRLEPGPGESRDLTGLLASLSSPDSDPAAAAQFQDEVVRVCAHLDPTERRVVELRLEGHTRDEIAAELGMDMNDLEHFHFQSCALQAVRLLSATTTEGSPMKTYPVEYRHRVVQLTTDGYSTSAIAAALGTSAAWVRSIKALHRSGRPLEPKSKANKRRSLAEREGGRICARVAEKPGTTLDDLRRDLGLTTSLSNLWNALRDLKLSLKKSPSGRPSGTGRMSPPTGPSGRSSPPASTPAASSSSTRPSAPRR